MSNTSSFGLTTEVWQEIVTVLNRYPLKRAVIYGSRAKGNYSDNSDIDIAIWTDDTDIKYQLRTDLDEIVKTACKFDVVDFKRLDSEKLRENILREGIEILTLP